MNQVHEGVRDLDQEPAKIMAIKTNPWGFPMLKLSNTDH